MKNSAGEIFEPGPTWILDEAIFSGIWGWQSTWPQVERRLAGLTLERGSEAGRIS